MGHAFPTHQPLRIEPWLFENVSVRLLWSYPMIGPAELEDILLDLQAAALDAGTRSQAEVFHPNFAVLPDASGQKVSEEQTSEDRV